MKLCQEFGSYTVNKVAFRVYTLFIGESAGAAAAASGEILDWPAKTGLVTSVILVSYWALSWNASSSLVTELIFP